MRFFIGHAFVDAIKCGREGFVLLLFFCFLFFFKFTEVVNLYAVRLICT